MRWSATLGEAIHVTGSGGEADIKARAKVPVDAGHLQALTWGTSAVDLTATIGLDQLLQSLQLLATDEARQEGARFLGGTPPSLQAIKSGALSSTKWASGAVGAGGLAAAATAVASALGDFGEKAGHVETAALLGGAAVLLGAVAIALSIFVGADLVARGAATAARHQGRAEVASAFLTATGAMPGSTGAPPVTHRALMLALATAPGRVRVTTDSFTDAALKRVEVAGKSSTLVYVIGGPAGEDRVKVDEIDHFRVAAAPGGTP